jgi:hypothetical protein
MPHLHPPTLRVEQVVDHDAVQPRAETAPALKGREPREYFNEDLLRCVLSILPMIEHAKGDVVDQRLMASGHVAQALDLRGAGELSASGLSKVMVPSPGGRMPGLILGDPGAPEAQRDRDKGRIWADG